MRGIRNLIRTKLRNDKQSSFAQFSKLRARKYVRVDRVKRFSMDYCHVFCWFSLCAFIVTLGPDILWIFTSDRALETPVSPVARFLPDDAGASLMQATSRVSSHALELKEETSQDIYVSEMENAVSIVKEGRGRVITDEGATNSLGLSAGFKLFIYDLPSGYNHDWLADSRCGTHLFAAEVAIHKILLTSSIRTLDPQEADFFFVPVYVSCNFSSQSGFPSLGGARSLLLSAVKLISHEMTYWNRSGGRDHIFVATHDYGACFHAMDDLAVAAGVPEFLQKSVILQTFGRKDKHPCQDVEHIQIPPYVSFSALDRLGMPPEKQHRDIWAFFRGKMEIHPKNISGRVYSRGIRTVIWRKFGRNRRFYIKRKHSADYQVEISRSVFCLCPLGWAPWSPRIVESVIFGCVPVIIADNISLPYPNTIKWSQISLSVRERDVMKLGKILEKVARKNLTTIQRNLWKRENRLALTYTQPMVKGDATWQMLELLTGKLNRSQRYSL